MKKNRSKRIVIATIAFLMAALMFCMLFAACGDDKPDVPDDEVAVVTSITVNTDNVKKTFAYGETFTYNGLVVMANFSDGTTESLPVAMCSVSAPDTKVPGIKTVTVTYKNIKTSYEVTVNERVMPPISKTPLAVIDKDDIYRIEAEDIDLEVSGVKAADGNELLVNFDGADGETETVNKYLANYGVEFNYFGFTFTSDKAYNDAIIVFRVANPTTKSLGIGTNMNVYLNYKSYNDNTQLDISDLTALPAAKIVKATEEDGEDTVEMEWATRIVRGVSIPAGTNTLTFDVLGKDVVCIDSIEIYAGVAYGSNSITELGGVGTVIKDVEEFDLEKIVVREDVKKAHNIPDGVAWTETASVNGANTHGGRCVAAMAKGSEITTALRLDDKATVHILYTIASADGYKVKDNYEFYIDGEKLDGVEDYFIKAGDPWRQGSQFYEWRDTDLGYYDLEAGDHIFTVKVTGKDCNCDCFKFDVVSYGEFSEHPAEIGKIDINGMGTYVMEGENVDMFYLDEDGKVQSNIISTDNITSGYYGIVEAADCSNGRYINRFDVGSKFTFTVYATEDTVADLFMRASRSNGESESSVGNLVAVTIDDDEITISENAGSLDESEWRTVKLAEGVALKGGELHTFTMDVKDTFRLDNISFVTMKYKDETPALASIKVGTNAAKTEYDVNDVFSYEGLTVTAVQNNGVTYPVESDAYTVSTPDMTTAGYKKVTVTHEGKTATYDITVHGAVEGISLDTAKAKTDYNFGDKFSLNGVTVTANTGNGTTKTIAVDECTVSTPDMFKTGAQTVTVTYDGKTATYEITVNEVTASATLTSEATTAVVEAEDLDRSELIKDTGNYTENWSVGGQSGTSLRGIQKGSVLKIYVQVDEDVTVNFKSSMSKYEAFDVKDMVAFSVDGVSYETPSVTLGRAPDGSNDWFNWKDIDFGNVELSAGLHVFTIDFINNGPNVDSFTLTVAQGD